MAMKRENAHEIAAIAKKYEIALTKIGVTGGRSLLINDAEIALDDLRSAYEDTIPRLFG